MLENKSLTYTYDVKKIAGDIFLIGNLGVSKLPKYDNSAIKEAVDSIDADMLALHTNPGQESVEPEGDIDFRGAYDRVCEVAEALDKPVVLKEVGNGISKEVASKMKGKIYAIDVQGAGGTTWIGVETYRGNSSYGKAFWEWGIPTALSVLESISGFGGHVWSSGGIRSAEDIAKSIAIGAEMCGMAKPVLVSERKGGAIGVYNFLNEIIEDLRGEMAKLGFESIKELSSAKIMIGEPLAGLLRQRKVSFRRMETVVD